MLKDLYYFAGNLQEEILQLQMQEETLNTVDMICNNDSIDFCY